MESRDLRSRCHEVGHLKSLCRVIRKEIGNMGNSKSADREMIKKGNANMLKAWNEGSKLSSPDGERPDMRAIRRASEGNASKAERLRKYRAMSVRIGKDELKQITDWCIEFERAWGPTFLCELSKVREKKHRQQIARITIKQRLDWSSYGEK